MDAFLDGHGAARRGRPDAVRDRRRWPRSSSAGSTPRSTRLDKIGTAEAAALRGAGGDRERPAGLPALRAGVRLTAVAGPGGGGARPQRPLWASTSVKDPAYPDTRYVVELVAPGVVNTMPEATLRAVADHGVVPADSVRGHYAECAADPRPAGRCGHRLPRRRADPRRRGGGRVHASWDRLSQQLSAALHEAAQPTGRTVDHDRDDLFVIVGASLAGAKAAQTLREEGFDARLS